MTRIYQILIVLCILSILGVGNTFGQCCSAGNPISADGNATALKRNALRLSLMYKNSYSDTYYHGSDKIDFEYKESYFHFTSLNLEYGLNDRLSISGNIGYFNRKGEIFVSSDYKRYSKGIGDGALSLNYLLYNSNKNKFSISVQGTVKFPIGAKEVMFEGVILPIDFQPSTGSMRYNSSLSIQKGLNHRWSAFGFVSYEFIEEIETGTNTYKYGDIVVGAVGVAYKMTQKITTSLQARYEWRDRRMDDGSDIIESTGGEVFYLVPQVSFPIWKSYRVAISYDLPAYRYMNYIENGTGQLGNKRIITAKIIAPFDVFTKTKQLNISELEVLDETSFFVDGICEMCKDRIEQSALKNRDVKWAEWNLDSKQLKIKFNESVDLSEVKKNLAKVGHDTKEFKASEKAYNNLHGCCKYRTGTH